jgi:urease accessory protein
LLLSIMNHIALLALLQLTSPALPVGAYSYSEGLETLVDRNLITNAEQLQLWLTESLTTGSIGIEAAILPRTHRAWVDRDLDQLAYWNNWLSATRESYELQQQNWQMGRSLLKLMRDLQLPVEWSVLTKALGENCNFAIAFAISAALSQIDERTTVTGYLYSWASNLVSAGVKLIPLGQTAGQQLLQNLCTPMMAAADRALVLPDEDLFSCNWGLALASMAHETQYSRLFRS